MAEELHKITPEELMKLYSDKSSFVLLAFSYLHDRDVAEDIFQESVLYILENRDTITVANARWYFSRVILNKCLYYLRQSSNRARIRDNIRDSAIMAENISILSDTASDMAAFNADLSGCLEQCRRELPTLAYNIFIDAKIKGLSYKDIAEAHNVTAWRRRCSVPLLSSGASSRIIGSFSSWFSAKGSIDLHPFGSCTFGTRYSLGADLCSRRLFVGPAVVALLETFRKFVTFRFVSNAL